jgi:hypothetical protein
VTKGWRKQHNKELRDLYSSPSMIRMMESKRVKWTLYGARMGEKRNAYKLLVGKLEGKEQLGRPISCIVASCCTRLTFINIK